MTQHTAVVPQVGRPQLGGSLVYLVSALPIAFCTGLPLVFLTMAGLGFTLVWVGIPALMVAATCWRACARMQRRWLRITLGVDIETPYRSLPPGSLFRRWPAKLADPATWRDIGYALLVLPISLGEFVVVTLWAYSIAFLTLPVWAPWLSFKDAVSLPDLRGHLHLIHTGVQALPYAVLGLVGLLLAIWLTPRLAWLHALLGRALLGPTRASRLEVTAERLQSSRARGVDAAEDRAATIDGVLTVASPPGGPTVVTAELPCVW